MNIEPIARIHTDFPTKFGVPRQSGLASGLISTIVFELPYRNPDCLRGIAKGAKKVVLMLSYPSDEVGNHLLDLDLLDEKGIDPYKDVLTQAEFETLFGKSKHTFTDMDYVNYYKELIEE